jgi:hypothetical protein
MYKNTIFSAARITNTKAKITSVAVGVVGLMVAMVAPMSVGATPAAGYSLFGDSMLVSPGHNSPTAAQFESSATVPPNYGGIDFGVPNGVTDLASLNNLGTDYMFTQGSCGGGAPRFSVMVTTPSGSANMFVYLGPAPSYTGCPDNVWQSTGNLVTPTSLVDASQLGGSFYESYAAVQAAYGSYPVTDVSLVTDAYWFAGTQTVQADNVQINNSTVTFESKNSCKNGGWQQFTAAPGPFKNQGDCVSYFANGGKN